MLTSFIAEINCKKYSLRNLNSVKFWKSDILFWFCFSIKLCLFACFGLRVMCLAMNLVLHLHSEHTRISFCITLVCVILVYWMQPWVHNRISLKFIHSVLSFTGWKVPFLPVPFCLYMGCGNLSHRGRRRKRGDASWVVHHLLFRRHNPSLEYWLCHALKYSV